VKHLHASGNHIREIPHRVKHLHASSQLTSIGSMSSALRQMQTVHQKSLLLSLGISEFVPLYSIRLHFVGVHRAQPTSLFACLFCRLDVIFQFLARGTVVEICGASCSGKTQVSNECAPPELAPYSPRFVGCRFSPHQSLPRHYATPLAQPSSSPAPMMTLSCASASFSVRPLQHSGWCARTAIRS
jgi:hypothetical protein